VAVSRRWLRAVVLAGTVGEWRRRREGRADGTRRSPLLALLFGARGRGRGEPAGGGEGDPPQPPGERGTPGRQRTHRARRRIAASRSHVTPPGPGATDACSLTLL